MGSSRAVGRRSPWGWFSDRCAECGVECHNGTDTHPPLCEACVPIWYPPDRNAGEDIDCRSIV